MFPTRQRIVQVHLGSSVIRTTADHPFYVPGKGWVSAPNLLGATSAGDDTAVPHPHASEQPTQNQPRPNFPIVGFVAGTPILTPEGSKPIEDVKPGDVILTQPDDAPSDHEPENHEDDGGGSKPPHWWEWN